MGVVFVTDVDGNRHQLDANNGDKVMELIRDDNLSIEAIFGGEGACATCHVHVTDGWYDKLPAASDNERDFVQTTLDYEPELSRLSCQIFFCDAIDGIILTIPDEE